MLSNQRSRSLGLLALVGSLALVLGLSGCENTRQAFGLNKSAPDEFSVLTRAPLSIPPDYGLRPPTPGVQRPQEIAIRDEARKTLITSGTDDNRRNSTAASIGETALLKRAGATNADPSIREQVSRENKVLVAGDKGFVDRIIFWRKDEPNHSEIDASAEARRLSENSAMGDTVVKGPTPVIERKKSGIFDGLFN